MWRDWSWKIPVWKRGPGTSEPQLLAFGCVPASRCCRLLIDGCISHLSPQRGFRIQNSLCAGVFEAHGRPRRRVSIQFRRCTRVSIGRVRTDELVPASVQDMSIMSIPSRDSVQLQGLPGGANSRAYRRDANTAKVSKVNVHIYMTRM